MLYQRLFLVALLVVYAVLAVATMGYQAAFSYEPVGPRAFPLLLLVLLAAGTVYLPCMRSTFQPALVSACLILSARDG